MTQVLYGGKRRTAEDWREAILSLRPELALATDPSDSQPEAVDILLYEPSGPIQDLAPYAGVAAIQSLWAGVEVLLANPTLPDETPILRMVEDGMTRGMTDYVVGHVYRAHLGAQQQQIDQRNGHWGDAIPPLTVERRVGIAGLGALGGDAAQTLARLGFQVSGWSRTPKSVEGVTCLSGVDGLDRLLRESEILVLLLPLTPETKDVIGEAALARMPQGAHLINVARGPLVDDAALLAALDSGKIAGATLDVFHHEPLPGDHRFWRHPRVLVTPHVASATRTATAAQTIIEQVDRFESGRPFMNVVDRERGY